MDIQHAKNSLHKPPRQRRFDQAAAFARQPTRPGQAYKQDFGSPAARPLIYVRDFCISSRDFGTLAASAKRLASPAPSPEAPAPGSAPAPTPEPPAPRGTPSPSPEPPTSASAASAPPPAPTSAAAGAGVGKALQGEQLHGVDVHLERVDRATASANTLFHLSLAVQSIEINRVLLCGLVYRMCVCMYACVRACVKVVCHLVVLLERCCDHAAVALDRKHLQ